MTGHRPAATGASRTCATIRGSPAGPPAATDPMMDAVIDEVRGRRIRIGDTG